MERTIRATRTWEAKDKSNEDNGEGHGKDAGEDKD